MLPTLLVRCGYQVVEIKCMVFTALADSKTIAMHAVEINVFVISPRC